MQARTLFHASQVPDALSVLSIDSRCHYALAEHLASILEVVGTNIGDRLTATEELLDGCVAGVCVGVCRALRSSKTLLTVLEHRLPKRVEVGDIMRIPSHSADSL